MPLFFTPAAAAQGGNAYAMVDRLPETAVSWRLPGASDSTASRGRANPYGAELIRPGLEPGIHISGGGPLLLYYRYPVRHYNMPLLRAPLLKNGLPWLNAPDSLTRGKAYPRYPGRQSNR